MSNVPTPQNNESGTSGQNQLEHSVEQSGRIESVHEIMDRIRRSVGEILRSQPQPFATDRASAQGRAGSADVQAGELQHSAELRSINHGHAYSLDLNPSHIPVSHRFGPLGRFVTVLKRRVLCQLRDSVLAHYFKSEHAFESSVTKFLNEVPRYIDERDGVIFRQLINKIDTDVGAAVERTDRGLQELAGSLETVKHELLERMQGGSSSSGRTFSAPADIALQISPSMSPHVVALVEECRRLSERVSELEKRLEERR